MNIPPTVGYARIRPAFEYSAEHEDPRWQEWHVIDERNGAVIAHCPPPQPHNLPEAIASLTECEHCWVGLETVETPMCEYCAGSGLEPGTESESCGECCGDGNVEISMPCQHCGRFESDIWVSPLGQAELIAGELNACYPDEGPTTEALREAVRRLRIEGISA